jgi:GNAT superfamily N-acetyltransferase
VDITSENLDESHVLSSFSCGKPQLDEWLRNSAIRGQKQQTGRTWVWHEGDGVVFAYFTLAAHVLHRESLSRSQGNQLPSEIPAVLLAKLALDEQLHGEGLGAELLFDALQRCVNAGQLVGTRYVVVDAIDSDARKFYEKYSFTAVSDNEPLRLIRRIRDIGADLTQG